MKQVAFYLQSINANNFPPGKSKKDLVDMRQAMAFTLPAAAALFSSEILTCTAPCTATAGSGHSTATRTKKKKGAVITKESRKGAPLDAELTHG